MNKSEWRVFDTPMPYCTVSCLAFDSNGNIPLLYRGPNVRSARNQWSLPSGLHEVGLTIEQQLAAELGEELNLDAVPSTYSHVGFYENILTDETPKSHWVIDVGTIRVKTLETLTNKEPDKHPEIRVIHVQELYEFTKHNSFAPMLSYFIQKNFKTVCDLVGGSLLANEITKELSPA